MVATQVATQAEVDGLVEEREHVREEIVNCRFPKQDGVGLAVLVRSLPQEINRYRAEVQCYEAWLDRVKRHLRTMTTIEDVDEYNIPFHAWYEAQNLNSVEAADLAMMFLSEEGKK